MFLSFKKAYLTVFTYGSNLRHSLLLFVWFKVRLGDQHGDLILVAGFDGTGCGWHILENLPMSMNETYGQRQ